MPTLRGMHYVVVSPAWVWACMCLVLRMTIALRGLEQTVYSATLVTKHTVSTIIQCRYE